MAHTEESENLWRIAYTDQAQKSFDALDSTDQRSVRDGMSKVSTGDPYQYGSSSSYSVDKRTVIFNGVIVVFWATIAPEQLITIVNVLPGTQPVFAPPTPLKPDVEEDQIMFARSTSGQPAESGEAG
jgi:hypothetical protein